MGALQEILAERELVRLANGGSNSEAKIPINRWYWVIRDLTSNSKYTSRATFICIAAVALAALESCYQNVPDDMAIVLRDLYVALKNNKELKLNECIIPKDLWKLWRDQFGPEIFLEKKSVPEYSKTEDGCPCP